MSFSGTKRRASTPATPDATTTSTVASPPASRASSARWRDPRLAIGIVLIAGCALLGARLMAAADDTVAVWSVGSSAVAGQPVDRADLVQTRVRFASQEVADGYLAADEALPSETVLVRDVAAGELLPRSAIGTGASDLVELPVPVDAERLPSGLQAGSVVDVWAIGADGGDGVRVLQGVTVLAAPAEGEAFGDGSVQLVVGLDAEAQVGLPAALGALAEGSVVVTRQVAP